MRKILIPHAEIEARVALLAERISRDYGGKEPVLVGVLKGVIFFFADLVMKMTIPTKMDFIRAASYGSGSTSSGVIRILKDVELPLKGADVIVVEDIVDTGLTLDQMIRHLEVKEPASIRICALIDKSERRTKEVRIDYLGFEVPSGFLIGYGLDYDEKYRYLPDICTLELNGASDPDKEDTHDHRV
jgi:hypoxanthine phosphoribosyltransferase